MEIRIFFAVMVAFVLLHLLFTFSRSRRMQALLRDDRYFVRQRGRIVIISSLLIPMLALIVVLINILLPAFAKFTVMFTFMQSEFFKYTGLFFIKLSLIWVLVTGMQMEKLLSEMEEIIGAQKIVKIEAVASAGILLFCIGVFFFQPNLVLFLLVLAALCMFWFKRNASFKAT